MQRLHDVFGSAGETHVQATAPDTTTVQTITAPKNAVAFLINCATTDARITLDGSTPASNNGLLIKKDQNPLYIAAGKTIKAVSTAAANSVIDVTWLK